MARVMDGRAVARALLDEVRAAAGALRRGGTVPTLAVLEATGDPAAAQYVATKQKRARAAGVEVVVWSPPPGAPPGALLEAVERWSADPAVHGIVLEEPLPPDADRVRLLDAIVPAKDVEGVGPVAQGRLASGRPTFVPATALAAVTLLERHGVPLTGHEAVVVGHSPVVGRPVAALLLARDATVTVCHKYTADLARHTRCAEVLVVATGCPGLIRGDMLRPGAAVVDVGTNVVGGRTVGDVVFAEAMAVAGAVSPVPGGVGPVTTAVLLQSVVAAAARQAGVRARPPRALAAASGSAAGG